MLKLMNKIIQCVPNFSEGRNRQRIEKIVNPFRGREGVKLLDYSNDEIHNRLVVTVAGDPRAVADAVVEAVGVAIHEIDMTRHHGDHPRMGAVDVIPFVPVKNVSDEEAIALSKEVAQTVSERYGLPVFLYEKSASTPLRENLANIRAGQFEGMAEKLRLPDWKPDYGPAEVHPTAGAVAVGMRMPLVAYNVNLRTENMETAKAIAKRVRFADGGLRFCKAVGVALHDRGMVQVSLNLTDFTKTAIYSAHELVRIEANRYGVSVAGAEIVGLVPLEALTDTVAYYLGLDNFSVNQVLETRISE